MKKLLALALAAVVAVSMGAVAFADGFYIDDPADIPSMEAAPQENDPGTTYYFPLFEEDGDPVTDEDIVKNWKAYVTLKDGDDLVKSVSIALHAGQYCIKVVTTKSYAAISAADPERARWDLSIRNGATVICEMKGYCIEQYWLEQDTDSYGRAWIDGFTSVDNDCLLGFLESNAADRLATPLVHAAGDEYLALHMGDAAVFEVKNAGGGEVWYNLYYETEVPDDVIEDNPNADLEAIFFLGAPTFKATGTLRYQVPGSGWYIYAYDDGALTRLDAVYDEDEDALVLETRTLGSYIISDTALAAADADGDADKSNPETGAAGMVGVAVALGTVSLAAAAAVALKK